MSIPEFTRYAREAAAAIGATFEDLDGGRGYLWRVSRGGRSVLGGGGGVCAYPINSAVAYTISRDKSHTKSVLSAAGLPFIPGGLFFAHTLRVALRDHGREVADAVVFAEQLGLPVFCKPNFGSRGDFAEIITSTERLLDYASRMAPHHESFLVEPLIRAPEHRVLVMDGRAIFHSAKANPAVIGDGRTTVVDLLALHDASRLAAGVSPSMVAGHAPDYVPAEGERIALLGRRNLSAAGGIETASEEAPPSLAALAVSAVEALGLRIGAVDLFDLSSAADSTDPVVIEVNGNPGLRTLELAGRGDLIHAIWTSMYEECLS